MSLQRRLPDADAPSEASEEGALNWRRHSDAAVELPRSFRLGRPSNEGVFLTAP